MITKRTSSDYAEALLITHIEDGLDFPGRRIQRHRKRGTSKHFVYLYPAKKALRSIMAKVKTLCRQDVNLPLDALLHQLNQVLRGWAAYFKHGSSKATFNYLRAYTWKQAFGWLRRKHRRTNWKEIRRKNTSDGMVARHQRGDSL
ncbi:group II intron maturase-specific domain-containing protein [Streptomyces sp. NPDC006872]|uniref:group II intron maturase-specific domain-containing protein n=1 Tax=Streptomyces sp. NPDC006872 TaxID=3155720 RepID=UPI0033EE40C4